MYFDSAAILNCLKIIDGERNRDYVKYIICAQDSGVNKGFMICCVETKGE